MSTSYILEIKHSFVDNPGRPDQREDQGAAGGHTQVVPLPSNTSEI